MARVTQAQEIQNANEEEALYFFRNILSSIPDPRRPQGKRYPFETVVICALMATVCGAEDAQAFEYWSIANEEWLCTVLDMPRGAPTQDVFLSVLGALDPNKFGDMLMSWARLLTLRLQAHDEQSNHPHIAIDGKTHRRSYDTSNELKAIHMLNAWSVDYGISLGQIKTEEKSNEITAIPELLALLDIRNTTITTDAMGCQREIASTIVEQGGDYLLAVKENQPSLYHQIEVAFNHANSENKSLEILKPIKPEIFSDVDKGHGRIEIRTIEISRNLDWIPNSDEWSDLSYIVKVTRERTIIKTDKTSQEIAYYIGSHPTLEAEQISHRIRRHWAIENELHWVLDMGFREDEARHRAKNTAQNMACLRKFSLNIIKLDKKRKLGVANSRRRAGWDRKYLVGLLINSRG